MGCVSGMGVVCECVGLWVGCMYVYVGVGVCMCMRGVGMCMVWVWVLYVSGCMNGVGGYG